MITSRETQKEFYVIHQSLQIKKKRERETIDTEGNHLEMISINYQKLTANMSAGERLQHYQEGRSEAAAMFSQGEDLGENSDSWAPPPDPLIPLESVRPGNLHFNTSRIIILHAGFENNFSHPHLTLMELSFSPCCIFEPAVPSSWYVCPPSVPGKFHHLLKREGVILLFRWLSPTPAGRMHSPGLLVL